MTAPRTSGATWKRREVLAMAAGAAAGSTIAGWPERARAAAPGEPEDRQADGGRAVAAPNDRSELRLEPRRIPRPSIPVRHPGHGVPGKAGAPAGGLLARRESHHLAVPAAAGREVPQRRGLQRRVGQVHHGPHPRPEWQVGLAGALPDGRARHRHRRVDGGHRLQGAQRGARQRDGHHLDAARQVLPAGRRGEVQPGARRHRALPVQGVAPGCVSDHGGQPGLLGRPGHRRRADRARDARAVDAPGGHRVGRGADRRRRPARAARAAPRARDSRSRRSTSASCWWSTSGFTPRQPWMPDRSRTGGFVGRWPMPPTWRAFTGPWSPRTRGWPSARSTGPTPSGSIRT